MDAMQLFGFPVVFDWHVAAMTIFGILEVVSLWPYLVDIIHGETRPNKVSFVLWTMTTGIAAAAMYEEKGWSFPTIAICMTALSMASITILALVGYGYVKRQKTDIASLILGVTAIIGWQVSGEPMVAIAFAIGADVCAAIPTIEKALKEPFTEHAGAWGLITVGYFFGALSSKDKDVADLAMLGYLTVMCGTIFLIAYLGQKRGVTARR
ncbi:MAG: hypothetical protein WA058_00250 [Minisyncoccia bacterium]